jgi:hypothetical protein
MPTTTTTTSTAKVFAASPYTCEGVFPAGSKGYFGAVQVQGRTRFLGNFDKQDDACASVKQFLEKTGLTAEPMSHHY